MNNATKLAILEAANRRRGAITESKGPEYTGAADNYASDETDVLSNFKRQGMRWGTDPLLPMGIYFGKHIDSIETFVREATRDGITLAEQQQIAARSEGILSRLDDARNYLDLMECLLHDLGIVGREWTSDNPYMPDVPLEPDAVGPVSEQDIHYVLSRPDGAKIIADDYNYLRERIEELTDQQRTEYLAECDRVYSETAERCGCHYSSPPCQDWEALLSKERERLDKLVDFEGEEMGG